MSLDAQGFTRWDLGILYIISNLIIEDQMNQLLVNGVDLDSSKEDTKSN